ncbi:MAG: glycoside hydrolase family 3 C-terminal domain-containing protein, partial [Myxococcota bacterium]
SLLEAVRDGTISRARLDRSLRRILSLKLRRGIIDNPPPPRDEALAMLGEGEEGREIADEIASRAVTLVRGSAGLTPIEASVHERIVVLSANRAFAAEMASHFPRARVVHTPAVPSAARHRNDLAATRRLAAGAELLVIGAMNGYQAEMVGALEATGVPTVVVSLGSPYMLSEFPDIDAYLVTYSYQPPAARAAARFLAGEIEASGRLPVSLPGLYPIGHTAAQN